MFINDKLTARDNLNPFICTSAIEESIRASVAIARFRDLFPPPSDPSRDEVLSTTKGVLPIRSSWKNTPSAQASAD